MEGRGMLGAALGSLSAAMLSAMEFLGSYWWLPIAALGISLVWAVVWRYSNRKTK